MEPEHKIIDCRDYADYKRGRAMHLSSREGIAPSRSRLGRSIEREAWCLVWMLILALGLLAYAEFGRLFPEPQDPPSHERR